MGAQTLGYSSDEHLISRLRAHDDHAFALLVGRYERQLLAFCRRMLGSHEDAEDVLQDTFAAAYKAILADERVIECRPWLYQIARNRCLNAIRGRRPTQPLSLDGIEREAALGTADQVARRVELNLLVNDILALPNQQRQALVLHELEGCSYEQISSHLGASVASVRSLLLRARRTLLALAEGRALPCAEARAQLDESAAATAAVRRHIELCSDCAAYKRQRGRRPVRVLRAISPLGLLVALRGFVPARLLRRTVSQATAGGAGAAGAGSAATAGAGSAATAGAGLSAVAAKALTGLAVLAAAGTGTVVVQQAVTGAQHHSRPPAVVKAPAADPAQNVSPAIPPPPASPSSVTRSSTHKVASPPPSSTTTSSTAQTAQPVTASNQGSQATTGVQTTSTPATAGRTRPFSGSGMSSARTRPVPVQAPNSRTTFPPSSSTGSSSGQGSSGTGSSQGSSGTGSSQGSSGNGSSQGSSDSSSSLSSATGTGSADTSASSRGDGQTTS